MQIGSIQLLEFRNYRTLEYSPSSRLNLLIGPNAQGKTNLLEAVGFLLTGRSFRTSHLVEVPRWGAAVTSVSGDVRRAEGGRTLRRTIRRLENGNAPAALQPLKEMGSRRRKGKGDEHRNQNQAALE